MLLRLLNSVTFNVWETLSRTLRILWVTSVGLGMGAAMYAVELVPNLPDANALGRIQLHLPLRVYSADGVLIGEFGEERRVLLTLDETPALLVDAILVAEDDRFYHHRGVDFPGLARAFISNLRRTANRQGASTITMQLARNLFLSPDQNYTRKIKEVLLALRLEQTFSKDEILQFYLNKIFLGHRAYGFAAAAQVYYGQPLERLNIPQLTMLAGLPKAPSQNNPISNPARATERRNYVLRRLHELGRIDTLSFDTARQSPVITRTVGSQPNYSPAPFVAELVRHWLYERFGDAVYQNGYRVVTTLDSKAQRAANRALRAGLFAYDERHGYRGVLGQIALPAQPETIAEALAPYPPSQDLMPGVVMKVFRNSFLVQLIDRRLVRVRRPGFEWARPHYSANTMGDPPALAEDVVTPGDLVYLRPQEDQWWLAQMPEVSGALISMDADTGAIQALIGGFDYHLSKFNRATQSLRQPGSGIKPFIYSAALEHGFSPVSQVSANPIVIENELEGLWRPENYSRRFFGPTPLRTALAKSLNMVSIRLLRGVGIESTVEHLSRFGFAADRLPHNLTLSLGSPTLTPLEMVAAYAVFANGGRAVQPYLIREITDVDGRALHLGALERQVAPTPIQPPLTSDPLPRAAGISPQNAFVMREMLGEVIASGSGRRALSLGRGDLGGKTGTSNEFRDAWFSGFASHLTTTVYVGFDQPETLGYGESGARAALPIWIDYMGEVLKDLPERPTLRPEGITTRFVNRYTGEPASVEDENGYIEYFIAGTEPGGESARTNLLAPLAPQVDLERLFE